MPGRQTSGSVTKKEALMKKGRELSQFSPLIAEFPERVPANFLNGYHLISSKGTTQFPIMGTIF